MTIFKGMKMMALSLIMVFAFTGPVWLLGADAYADEDLPVENTVAEETVEETAGETVAQENEITIVYDVVETNAKGSLYGELPSVVGDSEQQVGGDETVTISDIDATSYQTFTGNEKDRFPYYSYAFKGWMTEDGELVTAGSDVAAETLDADGDGVAVLSSVWSGSWGSGSGTPFAKFSLYNNTMSAYECFENNTLLSESASSYTPSVSGSIMVAIDDEGNTITPDELTSPSHGSNGHANVGDIYNNPELNFPNNKQGKYLMVSYMGSSVSQADADIRALAETGLHTSDSESGDVTWKLDNLPTDEEVLAKLSSFVSRNMTTVRDENGQRIAAEALTTDNYAVLWCQVKYQSGSNDGWNINGVLSTRVKAFEKAVAEVVEAAPVEAVPVEAAPVEAAPVEAAPAEAAPAASKPAAPAPIVSRSASVAASAPVSAPASASVNAEPAPAAAVNPVRIRRSDVSTFEAPAAAAEEILENATPMVSFEAPAEPAPAAAVNPVRIRRSDVSTFEAPAAAAEEILENATPMVSFEAPAETVSGGWAVLDLVLLALALYVLFPVLSLKRKADRVRELAGKGRAALAVEAVIVVIALAAFLAAQDFSAPMVIADALTLPIAAAAAAVCEMEREMRQAQRSRVACA